MDGAQTGHQSEMDKDKEQAIARKGRHIGLVIAVTGVCYILLSKFIAPRMGWKGTDLFLIDGLAIAGFVYALVNIFQLWRMRQDS